jgi:DNA-binding transcriptional ArsR family regulator
VLAWPVDEERAAVLAFLADGESWSSSALALALGTSQRTVQRALDSLAAAGKVQSFGRGRARRWVTPPVPGFATTWLLSALPLPRLRWKYESINQRSPRSSVSMGPFRASTACMESRTTVGTSGLQLETS